MELLHAIAAISFINTVMKNGEIQIMEYIGALYVDLISIRLRYTIMQNIIIITILCCI